LIRLLFSDLGGYQSVDEEEQIKFQEIEPHNNRTKFRAIVSVVAIIMSLSISLFYAGIVRMNQQQKMKLISLEKGMSKVYLVGSCKTCAPLLNGDELWACVPPDPASSNGATTPCSSNAWSSSPSPYKAVFTRSNLYLYAAWNANSKWSYPFILGSKDWGTPYWNLNDWVNKQNPNWAYNNNYRNLSSSSTFDATTLWNNGVNSISFSWTTGNAPKILFASGSSNTQFTFNVKVKSGSPPASCNVLLLVLGGDGNLKLNAYTQAFAYCSTLFQTGPYAFLARGSPLALATPSPTSAPVSAAATLAKH